MALKLHNNFLTTPSLTGHTAVATTPDYTITRATTATMVDADSYIREVQAGEARFTGATFRENLFSNAIDLDSNWTNKTRSTITSGKADPFGGTNAWGLNEDGSAANTHILQTPVSPGTPANNQEVTFSIYAKASNRTWIQMAMVDDGAATRSCNFDLTNGVVGAVSAQITETGIIDVGDGWYRCWLSLEVQTNFSGRVFIAEGDNDTLFDGLSQESVILYGAQSERVNGRASRAPTALIATSGAPESSLSGTSTKGLLVEEARTNICKQSEDLSTTWNTTGFPAVSITTNSTVAPDGSTTADTLGDDSSTGTGAIAIYQGVVVSTGTAYTASVFLKADGLDWGKVSITGQPGQTIEAYYDLTNGVLGATLGANNDAQGIEDYGSGWYRCWVSFTSDAADTTLNLRMDVAEANNDVVVDLDGTSSIYVWGAQLEAGAFPLSYIATTTTSVTRNADDVSTTDLTWFDTSKGTLYFKGTLGDVAASYDATQLSINDGGFTDEYLMNVGNDDQRCGIANSGGNNGSILFTDNGWNVAGGVTARAVLGFAQNDLALYFEGTAGTPDTEMDVPVTDAPTIFEVGHRTTDTQFWNGHIAEIACWDERLDNTALKDYSDGTRSPGWMDGVMTEDEWWSWRRRLYVNRQQPG